MKTMTAQKDVANEFLASVNNYIEAGLKAKNWTLVDLSQAMNLDPVFLQKLMAGNGSLQLFTDMCHHLGLEPKIQQN